MAFKKIGAEAVDVSLEKGRAVVKLKRGNTLAIEPFWEAVRNNGNSPRTTRIVARGVLRGTTFELAGTKHKYELELKPGDVLKHQGVLLEIEAQIEPGKSPLLNITRYTSVVP